MDPRIVELLQRLSEVDDNQLVDLEDILTAQLEDAAETKDVDTARSLAEAIDNVRKERSTREELARQREEEIKQIMSRVHAQSETNPDETNGGDDGNASEGDDNDGEEEEPPATTTASVKERPLPKIGDLMRTRSAASASPSRNKSPDRQAGTTTVIAASDVPGLSAGSEIGDVVTLRKAMVDRWESTAGSRTSGRLPVAKIQMNYPEDRILRAGDEEGNWTKIRKLLSPQALVASGGICAPPQGFYDTNTLATAARPLRDSLVVFQATRGAISFIPSISVSDVTGALGTTTVAEDLAGPTKPCLTIVCEDVDNAEVQAIHRCLQFGNFNARTHPEYVTHISELTLAAHARLAEEELWQALCASSTAVTADEGLGAWRDLYGVITRAASQFRSVHRMPLEATLRVAIPGHVRDMLNYDLVNQTPGDNTVRGVGLGAFSSAMSDINVRVTWTLEGSTSNTQVYGAIGVGPLDGWQNDIEMLMWSEGTFLFLDGGTLDLGIVRDSTLNSSNDFQTFAESFEGAANLGPQSLCITAENVCPSGLSAGSDDTPPCVNGS